MIKKINCGNVLDTLPQCADLNPTEQLWVYPKKLGRKRDSRNRTPLNASILEEWQNIPLEY